MAHAPGDGTAHQRKFTRTIRLDQRGSNVATFYTSSKFTKYFAFCTECGDEGSDPPVALVANEVSDDDEGSTTKHSRPPRGHRLESSRQAIAEEVEQQWPGDQTSPTTFEFDKQVPSRAIIEDEVDHEENRNVRTDVMTEFAHVHQQLGHLPPAKIQKMASEGILPRRLA